MLGRRLREEIDWKLQEGVVRSAVCESRQKPLDGHWSALRQVGLCRSLLTSWHHPARRALCASEIGSR